MDKGTKTSHEQFAAVFGWCESRIGRSLFLDKDARIHGRSSVFKLSGGTNTFYLKVYSDSRVWTSELFAYENWTYILGQFAPRLIDAYDGELKALLISALEGRALVGLELDLVVEKDIWRTAGEYLRRMHDLGTGNDFTYKPLDNITDNAAVYFRNSLEELLEKADTLKVLSSIERKLIIETCEYCEEFAAEKPVPCHRDYGPDNWIVTSDNKWAGVIDFEFSRYDLRMTDLARYPHWEWIYKPDLVLALIAGYSGSLTDIEKRQCRLLRVQYALDAIVWGNENSFFGFASEGHAALNYLAKAVE